MGCTKVEQPFSKVPKSGIARNINSFPNKIENEISEIIF